MLTITYVPQLKNVWDLARTGQELGEIDQESAMKQVNIKHRWYWLTVAMTRD